MKHWMIGLIVLILSTPSCGRAQPAIRQPVPLAKLQSEAANFDSIATGLLEAWNSRDAHVVEDHFTDNSKALDKSYGDDVTGPKQISGLISSVTAFGENWEGRQIARYIGVENGLAIDELLNVKFGNVQYTAEHPMMEVDWLHSQGNLISSWTIFYGLDTMEELGLPTSERLTEARAILSLYQSAWSSGDTKEVKGLYSSEAVREDSIFMEKQEGQAAITDFAASFFAWYPGAQWTLTFGFGEGLGIDKKTGGLYVIKLKDLAGQPCEINVGVLLETSDNLITNETLFYVPQSLINCGWAK